ncbi:MAG: YrhA family protein [Alphaproteobacteria bacterium]|nr:MAG: hypothetical protein B6I23_02035 [Rickettsiaceae bacterium 4572_127]
MIAKNAITFDGVNVKSAENVNSALKLNRFSELPSDFLKFLEKTNGYIYYDLEFYGTISHTVEGRFFLFPDILEYNKRFDEHDFLIEKLIIGQDSQSFFIYDSAKKVYLLCDRISFTPIEAFKKLADLMKIVWYN